MPLLPTFVFSLDCLFYALSRSVAVGARVVFN